ncbi:hypothetical protein JG068_09 [Burkholderia phage JG068]|uniref:Uncharacterized protein n=1 Tax=Burkholderia phage JG068 TaxID=1401297 RepID=U3PDI8_9CAUD|nr:hypothetical protein JG068_09 [Burkholderia phage JG068]AGW43591.1 hypothetical protein JG068_09 [Burkholderia phage JG068]
MNIGNVVKVVNARGCDNIAAGSFFTVRGVDDTCITIYNPNTKSLRRYAKYRFEVQRQQYKLKHQDPVVIRAASRSPVLRVIGERSDGALFVKHLFEPVGVGVTWVARAGELALANGQQGTWVAHYYSKAFGPYNKGYPESTQEVGPGGGLMRLPAVVVETTPAYEHNSVLGFSNPGTYLSGIQTTQPRTYAVNPPPIAAAQRPAISPAALVAAYGASPATQAALTETVRVQKRTIDIKTMTASGLNMSDTHRFFGVGPLGVQGNVVAVQFSDAEQASRFAKLFVTPTPDTEHGWRAAGKLVLRGQANGLGRYAVEFVSFVNDAIPEQRALFVTAEGPSKGTVILRHANGKSVSGESYDVVTA